jgi:hypothetical protein
MSLYDEVKGWQSGIAALLGFVALIIGALWNFRLNRRRDAALRAEEAISVAAALYGEVVLLRMEVAGLARAVSSVAISVGTDERNAIVRFDKHFMDAHVISEASLYIALSSKLGLLPAELIIAITQFHNNIQQVRNWLPLLVDDPTRGYVYGASQVLVPARDAVFDIVPAMRMIEQMAKMPKRETEVDLGYTEAMIAQEGEP